MKLPVDRKFLLGLVLAGLCMGGVIVLAYRTTGQLQDTLELTQHTQDIVVKLGSVSTDLVELETGQRGYLLTGDEHYLQPSLAASGRLDDDLAALTALIGDDEPDNKRLAALGNLVMQKRAELARTIELYKTQGLQAALAVAGAGEGQKSMDALRSALGEMARQQNRLLDIRKDRQQRDARTSIVAASLMAFLTALLLVAIYWLIRREMTARAATERTGADRYAQLEEHVVERTQALQISNAALAQEIGNHGSAEVALDQSQHDLAEALTALRRSEARLSGIIHTATDAIIAVDETQHILLANPAAEQMFGCRPEGMLGAPLEQFIPARFRAIHRAHIERFGATGVSKRRMGEQSVLSGLRAGGEEFPIEASISQLTERDSKVYTVILRDVTERFRVKDALDRSQMELAEASAALVRSEARLSGIIATASDAIITVDDTQHIVLVNPAAETVFRCRPGEMVGAPLERLIPERHRAAHREHIQRFGATGVTARRMGGQLILSGMRCDGEEFPIEASISQLVEESGRLYTVILRDVTERKQVQDALEYSHRELQELSSALQSIREEERKRIARELHDDLGQLLAALRMDLSLLKGRLSPAQPELSTMADKMDQLVLTTVVSLRRIAADLRPKVLDDIGLYPALQSLVGEFSQRQNIACRLVAIEADLSLDETRATSLFRMTQEALSNVAKHARATTVTVAIERNGDDLVLTVQDNGRGMSAGDRRKSKSFGLIGMRERAYILGGDFSVESQPGAGTTIRISLPCP